MTAASARVDVNVPRFNQAMVAAAVGVAFALHWWPLVAVTAGVLALTRFAGPGWGLFTQAYLRLVRPRRRRPIETEEAGPPRFAQLLGVVFLSAASALFAIGWSVAGWTLALIVFSLALLAATTRICVGCIFYERVIDR